MPLVRPTAKPTTSPINTINTIKLIVQIRFHPPRLAMYSLFRKSSNFSPFGPVTSQNVYLGGEWPLP